MRVAVAPTGFKGCLNSDEVAEHIRRGVHRAMPGAVVDAIPLIDGGEGSARLLAEATGGELVPVTVTGPVGRPVASHFALLGGQQRPTAFVEMAAAAGLSLVPAAQRDPGWTTSRGVGELISAALDRGVQKIVVGCGDSGICDGGAGALQALGARVCAPLGEPIGEGGLALRQACRVDVSGLDSRLSGVDVEVAVNPRNVLCGAQGVARRYGPQKGASAQQVEQLAAAMDVWAGVLGRHSGLEVADMPGAGASGGLGAGLAGVLGARLRSRFDVFFESSDLDARLQRADIVITAEGAIDASTVLGKVPAEVARRAKRHGVAVIALCGTIGPGADSSYGSGIDAFTGILTGPGDLAEAMRRAPELLSEATVRVLRMVLLGRSLNQRQRAEPAVSVHTGTTSL